MARLLPIRRIVTIPERTIGMLPQDRQCLGASRPHADELTKETRDEIIFFTRKMDNSRQRRVLRNFGSRYDYLPGEVVDDDGEERHLYQ